MKNKLLDIIVILIASIILIILTGCGNDNQDNQSTNSIADNTTTLTNDITDNNQNNNRNDNAVKVSLKDFVGTYRGFNPFYVTNWETYEMSGNADNSTMSFVKSGDDFMMTDINIDSNSTKTHKKLDPVTFKDSEMTYYLDAGQEDLWDCLSYKATDGWLYQFCKRRKDGQLIIAIGVGSFTESFAVNK